MRSGLGRSKDTVEVWRQLSHEIGAEFIEGGFWGRSKVQARVGPWTVTLELMSCTSRSSEASGMWSG